MIVKNLDHTIVGSNYLSALLGIELVERDNSVLLLDDERLKLGNFFNGYLSSLDIAFLREWGEERNLTPLKEIESYLQNQKIYFIGDDVRLVLGQSPSQNLRELLRKYPELFAGKDFQNCVEKLFSDPQSFDEHFNLYISKLGFELFRFNSVSRIDINTFLEKAPEGFLKFYHLLENNIEAFGETKHGKVLIFSLRSYFQKNLNYQTTKIELLFLFICLLCPNYKLNNELFVKNLVDILKLRGGFYKNSQIKEWFFYKGKPWSMELSSYEGVIHPQKLVFLGGFPQSMPLSWSPVPETYTAVHTHVKTTQNLGEGLYICSQYNGIGTDHPVSIFSVDNNGIDTWTLVFKRKGSKVEFIRSTIESHVKEQLINCFPIADFDFDDLSFDYVSDVWVNSPLKAKNLANIEVLKLKKMKVVDSSKPGQELGLRNVYYFGPLKDGPLGLLTSLLDIKDSNQYL